MIILEELEHAKKRGANIYAEIAGYGSTADAFRITDTHPEGRGAISCHHMALADAGLNIDEIDYINAHGTSTAVNDRVESLVLWSAVANPVDTYKTVLTPEAVLAGLDQDATLATLPWGAEVMLNQPFYAELYTTDPLAAVSHYDGPLQVVVGSGDTVVAPQPWYGESYMAAHEGEEELVVVEGDHVFDVFAGNGAPALDDATAESVDWFVQTLE